MTDTTIEQIPSAPPDTQSTLYDSKLYSQPAGNYPLYPKMSCNSQQFRLVEIQKMRDDLDSRKQRSGKKLKRYNKQCRMMEYGNMILSTASLATGSTAAVSVLPVITAPISIPLGVVSGTCGIISVILTAVAKNRRRKIRKEQECHAKDREVYGQIITQISRAIEDKFITPDEFDTIKKVYEGGNKMTTLNNDVELLSKELSNIIGTWMKKNNK